LEITSSFWGLETLTSQDVPRRRMTWLTQQAKDQKPADFPLTKQERKLGMKQTGRVLSYDKKKGRIADGRMPLVVPLKTKSGTVVFRAAPLTFGDAWVHPGIARYTFLQRAIKKGRKKAAQIIGRTAVRQMFGGKP
jgi:hypothetical protein